MNIIKIVKICDSHIIQNEIRNKVMLFSNFLNSQLAKFIKLLNSILLL